MQHHNTGAADKVFITPMILLIAWCGYVFLGWFGVWVGSGWGWVGNDDGFYFLAPHCFGQGQIDFERVYIYTYIYILYIVFCYVCCWVHPTLDLCIRLGLLYIKWIFFSRTYNSIVSR